MDEHSPQNPRGLSESHRLVDAPECRVSVLSNGLTLVCKRHTSAPVVAVRAYVQTGTVFEDAYLGSGISHLMEHVVTGGGSATRNEQQLIEMADDIGGLVNAYTAADHICYYLTAAKEHLAVGVELLAEWIVRPAVQEEVFKREVGVVLRELERDRDDPETQLDELFHEAVYRGHPMQYPVIGHPDTLKQLTYQDLVSYVHHAHAPSRLTIVVVGDVTPDEVLPVVTHEFSSLHRRSSPMPTLPPVQAIVCPVRAVRRMDVESSSMEIAWLTVCEGTRDDAALDLLSSVLTEGAGARLVRRLRWEQSLVFDISGTHASTWHTTGTFQISAQFASEQLDAVEQGVLDVIEELARKPITQDELDRAKRQAVMAVQLQRQTAEGLATQIGEDIIATGSVDFSDKYLANIEAVTLDDLHRVAGQYLRPDRRVLTAIVPEYQGEAISSQRCESVREGVCRSELANGVTCLTRHMPESPFVAIYMSLAGGLCYESAETNGLFHMLAEVLPRGTRSRSADEISDFFASRGTGLVVSSGMSDYHVACVGKAEECETLFEVLADVVTSPALAQAELDRVRPSICDAIMRIDEDWHTELIRFARGCFFKHSPYRFARIGTIENVRRFSAEDLARLHAECTTGSRIVVSVAGNTRPDEIQALAERCLGNLTRGESVQIPACESEPVITADRLFVKRADEDREVAGLFLGYPGYAVTDLRVRGPLSVLWAMLTGYALSGGRLYGALRGGDRDMVYDVSGTSLIGALPGYVGVTAACEPEKVGEVYCIIREQLDSVQRGDFSAQELQRAKAMIVAGELDQLQTPVEYARRAGFDATVGLSTDDHEQFLAEIQQVTPEAVLEAASAHLTHAIVAVVTPEPDRVDLDMDTVRIAP